MKKVMLIGDSIRLNYQSYVQEELKNEFDVWGTGDNCRFAKYTLNELERMLEAFSEHETKQYDAEYLQPASERDYNMILPDIIHWNNGLWDTAVVYEEDGAFTPLKEYLAYIGKILRELRKITPNIIFATTTPVKSEKQNQRNDIISDYNIAIKKLMLSEGVMVNDLHALVSSDINKYISDDNIHLSEDGKKACAKQVADYIRGV